MISSILGDFSLPQHPHVQSGDDGQRIDGLQSDDQVEESHS